MSELKDDYLDTHYIHRSNWLRAAVLGANDGILSTASLAIGVAAACDFREPYFGHRRGISCRRFIYVSRGIGFCKLSYRYRTSGYRKRNARIGGNAGS